MIIQKKITFCENQTAPFISTAHFNPLSDVLSIQVDGNFLSSLVKIEGRSSNATSWVPLAGINLSDFSVTKKGISKPGLYEFGVIGIREFRINIEQVDGTVSVSGQLINAEET